MTLIQKLGSAALAHLDPETAHRAAIRLLEAGAVPRCPPAVDDRLAVAVAGLAFPNPVGLAAGFDKNARAPEALLRLGFGHVEIGTVTPRPQAGNPSPRLFRLPRAGAVINRLGFNNDGHAAVLARMSNRERSAGLLGVNIGANRDSTDFVADYVAGIDAFGAVADYFTVNVSSPNTPGLRSLQDAGRLGELLARVLERRDAASARRRPVFLKIAPDLDEAGLDAIALAVEPTGLDGLIVANTTLSRAGVGHLPHAGEAGGLSGRPLFERSTIVLARMRQRLAPGFPIIGVGGIDDAESAWQKLEAGADLVQLYTGMIYKGPCTAAEICRGLSRRLDAAELETIVSVTGRKTDEWAQRPLPEDITA